MTERLRDFANVVCRHDPLVRQMYRDAGVVLCKTPASLAWVPVSVRDAARLACMMEIGVEPVPRIGVHEARPSRTPNTLKLLYVGRFLAWKGVDFGLRTVAELKRRGVDVSLTMIGQGPEAARWRKTAEQLGISDALTWISWLNRPELMREYRSYDALLLPSLHDSSGNVVLESMAHGLPVVCLDLGGPAQIVDRTCGIVVGTTGLSAEQVVSGLSEALEQLAGDPARLVSLGEGALSRAASFSWAKVVAGVWSMDGLGSRLVKASRFAHLAPAVDPARQADAGVEPDVH
jgi:glycosyltransferase involved in cell wall biosynthesis